MGFSDFIKNAADKTTEIVKSEMDKKTELKQLQAEQEKMIRASFQINSGFQQVNATQQATMFQRTDGTVYFNTNFHDSYIFIGYDWSGPRFDIASNSTTNTDGQEVTKGKGGKMLAGAAIGALAGPVGMAVGAAIGAGGKKKKFKKEQSATNSVQRQIEVLTPATLRFRDSNSGALISLVIGCNSLIDSQLKGFQIQSEQSVNEVSKDATDALKGIKALKELLDMGAITQEEFDRKKEQLLNN